MTEDEKLTMDMKSSEDQSNPNAATEQIVFARTRALTDEDLARAAVDPSTLKCSRMESAINARTANLDAAARRLKGGPDENEYGLTP